MQNRRSIRAPGASLRRVEMAVHIARTILDTHLNERQLNYDHCILGLS